MKISFVVPAYNEQDYIGPCLESIVSEIQQSGSCGEIIVVNNASTDKTKEIALSFSGVKVIDEPKKGLAYARQAGYLASSGDLIANIDADSLLAAGWIDTVVKKFRHPKIIALSGPVIYHDLPVSSNIFIRIYYYFAYISYIVNRFILRSGSLIQGANFVVRRTALQKVGGFNTAFSFYGEDTETARRLHKIGPVVFTFSLPLYTSGRRLKAEGFITMGWKYPINYFWTIFFKKPFTAHFIDIRTNQSLVAMRTTIQSLQQAIAGIMVSLSLVFVLLVSGGVYVSSLVAQLAQPTVAEAKQSNSFVVRRFGPNFIKMRQKYKDIKNDTDDVKLKPAHRKLL